MLTVPKSDAIAERRYMRNPKNTLVRNSTDLKHINYLRKVKEELFKD
jgi:hypothetical protein